MILHRIEAKSHADNEKFKHSLTSQSTSLVSKGFQSYLPQISIESFQLRYTSIIPTDTWGRLLHSSSVLDCWSTGRAIDPAPGHDS